MTEKTDANDTRALIIGGSSGIGLEATRRLVEKGVTTILVARDAEKLAPAKAGLEAGHVAGRKPRPSIFIMPAR